MSTIAALARDCVALSPETSIAAAAETLLDSACEPFLSLPVLEGNRPVGVLTRHAVQQVYLSRFGRDLYGRRTVADLMQRDPICVEADSTVEDASPQVTARIGFPIREDFIITRDGDYAGMGVVVDLLKAMDQRIARRNQELAGALHRLKESQAHLVQSEKMASLGQMVAGVAHELNTPLGYVRNNVEMLQGLVAGLRAVADETLDLVHLLGDADADPDHVAAQVMATRQRLDRDAPQLLLEDLGQLLEDTIYGCTQIGELVSSLKDFSRLDRAASEDVDINECVAGALLIARNVLKERVEVLRDLGDLPPIACVPSQINQVLLNLITNGAQAIDGRGRILVRTRHEGGHVSITVQDTGKGIPRDVLPRIFDPFFTTKPVGQGTGLGLAICYRIVQEHGGALRVASAPGRGTRFVVSLPVSRDLPATAANTALPAPEHRRMHA